MANTITVELTPRQIEIIVEMLFENYSVLNDEQIEVYGLLSKHHGGPE